MKSSSLWEPATEWYDQLVGEKGHYYHRNLVLPKILQKIHRIRPRSLLDIACGQGVLSRHLPPDLTYLGIDIAPSLIQSAIRQNRNKNHQFVVGDVRKPLKEVGKRLFDCATLLLSIQDIDEVEASFHSLSRHLRPGASLFLVMNHPCFRIPRHSGWEVHQATQTLRRTVDGYLTPLAIPIQTQPGKKESSAQVIHYHRPLAFYVKALQNTGFLLADMEEWISDKASVGAHRKRENRARKEFPLFLYLEAVKTQEEK